MHKCKNAKCDLRSGKPISVPSTGEQTRLAAQKKSTNTTTGMMMITNHDSIDDGDGQQSWSKIQNSLASQFHIGALCFPLSNCPTFSSNIKFPFPMPVQYLRVQNTNLCQNYFNRGEKMDSLGYTKKIAILFKIHSFPWEDTSRALGKFTAILISSSSMKGIVCAKIVTVGFHPLN